MLMHTRRVQLRRTRLGLDLSELVPERHKVYPGEPSLAEPSPLFSEVYRVSEAQGQDSPTAEEPELTDPRDLSALFPKTKWLYSVWRGNFAPALWPSLLRRSRCDRFFGSVP